MSQILELTNLSKEERNKARLNFIVQYNHNQGLKIHETENSIYALEANEIFNDGSIIIDPNYKAKMLQEERESYFLTNQELRCALAIKQIELDELELLDKITFNIAKYLDYKRFDDLILALQDNFGYADEDIDFLFKYKVFPY